MFGGSLFLPAIYVQFAAIDGSGRLLGHKRLGCVIDSGADCTFLPSSLLPVFNLSEADLPKISTYDAAGRKIGELPEAQLIAHILGRGIEITACFDERFDKPLLGRKGVFESLNVAFAGNQRVLFADAS